MDEGKHYYVDGRGAWHDSGDQYPFERWTEAHYLGRDDIGRSQWTAPTKCTRSKCCFCTAIFIDQLINGGSKLTLEMMQKAPNDKFKFLLAKSAILGGCKNG